MSSCVSGDYKRVGRAAALLGAGPYPVSVGQLELVLVRTSEGLRCFQGLCPHQGAALADGAVHGDHLLCPKHRWRFGSDGQRVDGPEQLRCYPVKVLDGDVLVDVSGGDGPAASEE